MADPQNRSSGQSTATVRVAERGDLPAVVRMLADDPLGVGREEISDPLPAAYRDAFEAMRCQGGNDLLVAEIDGAVVGCLQLTLIPGLARRGMLRGQIEGVRVDGAFRGRNVGETLILAAVDRARAAGAGLVQLTTDHSRADARRFYERLGFVHSHAGMKLALD